MTRVQEIKRQIERDEYDETDSKKVEAVVDGVLADIMPEPENPMTFAQWWASDKDIQAARLSFNALQWATIRTIAELAHIAGEQRQIRKEMERLNA